MKNAGQVLLPYGDLRDHRLFSRWYMFRHVRPCQFGYDCGSDGIMRHRFEWQLFIFGQVGVLVVGDIMFIQETDERSAFLFLVFQEVFHQEWKFKNLSDRCLCRDQQEQEHDRGSTSHRLVETNGYYIAGL